MVKDKKKMIWISYKNIYDTKKSNKLAQAKETLIQRIINKMTTMEKFWELVERKQKPNQLQRYEKKNAPEYIKKFIAIGGGPKMGITMEKYARFQFSVLKKRKQGKEETGYDHILETKNSGEFYIEQKSSGHWGEDDFKWQHVEEKHKWNILLLCGITYTRVRFWFMSRDTFMRLIEEGKITNQGNKAGDSSEGRWFSYSVVKDFLVEVTTDEEIETFIANQDENM